MRQKKKLEKEQKIKPRFSRAILPPEKFHSTKKGKRGYLRDEQKKAARQAQEEIPGTSD